MNFELRHPKLVSGLALLSFLALTFLAPLPSVWMPPGEWYRLLHKPSWTPPSWLFGPVWSLLYLLMGISAWLLWKRSGWSKELRLWLLQLCLNAAWTPLFFGWHRMGWAFVEICLLWLAVLATILTSRQTSRLAAALLLPYLAWVTFAAALNFAIWSRNP